VATAQLVAGSGGSSNALQFCNLHHATETPPTSSEIEPAAAAEEWSARKSSHDWREGKERLETEQT
jgi:hypothetical protein